MKREEKKIKNNKTSKQRTPKVKSFARPFDNERTVTDSNAYNVFYDKIGNDIFLSDCDPNGSYTGITKDGLYDRPVQDVDDL